jgi:hypothetical protein
VGLPARPLGSAGASRVAALTHHAGSLLYFVNRYTICKKYRGNPGFPNEKTMV